MESGRQTAADRGALATGPLWWFADWPVREVPVTGSLVYTVWDRSGAFIYVGMAGRSASSLSASKGPFGRLTSHASGRRSGDQFCIYICDRLVLPHVHNRISDIADGRLSLDALTRAYIRSELGFRFVVAPGPAEAFVVERALQKGEWPFGRPLLDPGPEIGLDPS